MIKVALTGGIGSGKSFVAQLFQTLNIPIYYADKEAKRLMSSQKELKNDIKALLGQEAYHRNGRLNRGFVASKIFNDKLLLKAINKLVHPAVGADFILWANNQQAPYVIEESALVFEIKSASKFDHTILVVADEEIRINRVMKRDKTDRNQVLSRMSKQWPDKKKMKLANHIIFNNEKESLIQQVVKIHNEILKQN